VILEPEKKKADGPTRPDHQFAKCCRATPPGPPKPSTAIRARAMILTTTRYPRINAIATSKSRTQMVSAFSAIAGQPTDPDLGPLISRQQQDRVRRYVDGAAHDGGRLLLGGTPPEDEELQTASTSCQQSSTTLAPRRLSPGRRSSAQFLPSPPSRRRMRFRPWLMRHLTVS
jgi:Aldehyde dehydrogenase family